MDLASRTMDEQVGYAQHLDSSARPIHAEGSAGQHRQPDIPLESFITHGEQARERAGQNGRSFEGCLTCRKAKVKCDEGKPKCGRCVRRQTECDYQERPNAISGRVRKFHKRSTAGCSTCRARRVKCDERPPVCGPCAKRGCPCGFSTDTTAPEPPATALRASTFQSSSSSDRPSSSSWFGMADRPSHPPTHPDPSPLSHPQGNMPYTSRPRNVPTYQQNGPMQLPVTNQTNRERPFSPFEQPFLPNSQPPRSIAYAQSGTRYGPIRPTAQLLSSSNQTNTAQQATLLSEPRHHPNAGSCDKVVGQPLAPPVEVHERYQRLSIVQNESRRHGTSTIKEEPGMNVPDFRKNRDEPCLTPSKPGLSLATVPPPAIPTNIVPISFANLLNDEPLVLRHFDGSAKLLKGEPQNYLDWGKQLDPLTCFFPLERDRILYRHFTTETVNTMIAMGDLAEINPFQFYLIPLALGKPAGSDVAHDAFRTSILAFSAYDLGYRIAASSGISKEHIHTSPIVQLSEELRLEAGQLLGEMRKRQSHRDEQIAHDLALATCVVLSFRDRVAASSLWIEALLYAVQLVRGYGGPIECLMAAPSVNRRFVLEQMVCIDVFASWLTLDEPMILKRGSLWWEVPYAANAPRALYAHVEIVYGIDRPMMDYLTRFMTLFSDGRHTALNRAGKQSLIVVPSTPQEMAQRWSDFREGSQVLLKEAEELAYQTNGTPYPDRIVSGRILWLANVSVWLELDTDDSKMQVETVNNAVKRIHETMFEALGRGMITHLSLPFLFGAYLARGEARDEVKRILELLEPYCRMDWVTLNRYIVAVWNALDTPGLEVDLSMWRQIYDDAGLFLPYI